MTALSKDELITLIEQAFADMKYPGDRNIAHSSWDADEVRSAFQGKRWKDLTDVSFLRVNSDALVLFEPEAFRYYLPAFMLAVLRDPETADVIISSITFLLTPPEIRRYKVSAAKLPAANELFSKRVTGFTLDQKRAIKEYLNFEIYPVEWAPKALQEHEATLHFWETFEG